MYSRAVLRERGGDAGSDPCAVPVTTAVRPVSLLVMGSSAQG